MEWRLVQRHAIFPENKRVGFSGCSNSKILLSPDKQWLATIHTTTDSNDNDEDDDDSGHRSWLRCWSAKGLSSPSKNDLPPSSKNDILQSSKNDLLQSSKNNMLHCCWEMEIEGGEFLDACFCESTTTLAVLIQPPKNNKDDGDACPRVVFLELAYAEGSGMTLLHPQNKHNYIDLAVPSNDHVYDQGLEVKGLHHMHTAHESLLSFWHDLRGCLLVYNLRQLREENSRKAVCEVYKAVSLPEDHRNFSRVKHVVWLNSCDLALMTISTNHDDSKDGVKNDQNRQVCGTSESRWYKATCRRSECPQRPFVKAKPVAPPYPLRPPLLNNSQQMGPYWDRVFMDNGILFLATTRAGRDLIDLISGRVLDLHGTRHDFVIEDALLCEYPVLMLLVTRGAHVEVFHPAAPATPFS